MEVDENQKMIFLVKLYQDRESFNGFSKEILNNLNNHDVYLKYKAIAEDYITKNTVIG